MRLPFVRYVRPGRLSPYAGRCYGPLILIDARYRRDRGLLAHEMRHYDQWRAHPLLHPWRYWLDPGYRYRTEIEAYRVQITYSTAPQRDAARYAHYIRTRYRLSDPPSADEIIKELLR